MMPGGSAPSTSTSTASGGPGHAAPAIVGSMERFIGILIEHHAGQFPAWLAPVQAVVMNITDAQADYAGRPGKPLRIKARVDADLRNEKIGYKIREHTLQRVPYLLVVGDREKEQRRSGRAHAWRGRPSGTMSVADFAQRLRNEANDGG